MSSRVLRRRFRRIAERQRWGDLAQDAGLYVYFGLYCALIAGCLFGFHKLMQPAIYPNPGAPAYTATALPPTQLAAETPDGATGFASAVEREEKPGGAPAKKTAKSKKTEHQTAAAETKRKRVAKKHDPMMDYAAQPSFGSYQTWGGTQKWNGYRSFGSAQAVSGHRQWRGYRGWGGYRNGH